MRLKGKRVAILTENYYEDLELWYPYYRLIEEGTEVKLIGSGKSETYKGKNGYPARVDYGIEAVRAQDFDGVIVPGGYAPDHFRRHPPMIQFIRDIHDQGKLVAAICHAPWALISAGILRGRTVTCFYAIKDDVVNAGAHYVDREVVRDGQIVTSRQPGDLPAFCRTIIEALEER